MSQVVTELVIDSKTDGAADYERAMDGAAQAAGRGSSAAADYGVAIAAVGTGALAAIAGVKSFLDQVAVANKGLADLQQNAKTAGLTMERFQGLKFGANVSGVSDDQFNAGLQKSAALLNDAQRNANSLSKLFDENGDSIKRGNGQLISENQLLEKAAGYIKNAATEQDKIKIAEMLGFTRQWVPYLEQGAGAMADLASQAKAAGVIIDDATIRKAAEFDSEWRKSTITAQANLKAMFLDVLPYIDDLILRADKFVTTLKNRGFDGVVHDVARGALTAAGIDPDATHKIELAPEVINGWGAVADKAGEIYDKLKQTVGDDKIMELVSWWKSNAFDLAANAIPKALNIATDGAFPASPVQITSVLPRSGPGPTPDEYQPFGKYTGDVRKPKPANGDPTLIPGNGSDANDPVDRAINTLKRHTAQQEADTAAAGLGAAALAQFRAEASLQAAVVANGNKATAQQRAQFEGVAKAAGEAAAALAKAKTASDIQFGRRTAFLSQEDVAIATQLKGIYGNDIPKALASAEASGIRFNNSIKETSNAFQNSASPALLDFETGVKSGKDAVADFEKQFVRSLLNMMNQMLIFAPIARALQGSLGGFGLGGGLLMGSTMSSGLGAGTGGLSFPMFAAGTDDAPGGLSMINEGGRGEIVDLPNGSRVIPHDVSMKMAANSNSGVTIGDTNIVVQGNADERALAAIRAELAAHRQLIARQLRQQQASDRYARTGVG